MKARVDQDDRLRRTRMTIVDLAVACGYKKCPLNKPTKSVRIEYSAVFTHTLHVLFTCTPPWIAQLSPERK